MQKKKILRILIVVVYVLFIAQFIFSNFYKVIGPNYIIKTTAYTNELDKYCSPSSQKYGCLTSCPNLAAVNTVKTPNYKGFPFATNYWWNNCGFSVYSFNSSDFNLARILNYVYIVVITGIAIILFKKVNKPKTH